MLGNYVHFQQALSLRPAREKNILLLPKTVSIIHLQFADKVSVDTQLQMSSGWLRKVVEVSYRIIAFLLFKKYEGNFSVAFTDGDINLK